VEVQLETTDLQHHLPCRSGRRTRAGLGLWALGVEGCERTRTPVNSDLGTRRSSVTEDPLARIVVGGAGERHAFEHAQSMPA
jgi:hypothetical protein